MKTHTLRWAVAIVMAFFLTADAMAMRWFTPKEEIKQSNAKAVEQVQSEARDKINRIVEGEKTPVRPVVVAPQPSVSLRGDNNIYFAEPQQSQAQQTPDEVYAEYLERRKFWADYERYRMHSTPYRESTSFESSAGAGAQSDKRVSESDEITIPLGVKLIFLAIGIGGLLWVIRWAVKSSAAATALAKAADETIAAKVRANRARAQTSKDDAEIADLTAQQAELEADRGRLAAKARELGIKL